MATINIKGLNKAKLLAALYNASKTQGFGILQFEAKPMTEDEAAVLLERQTYFDYLKGRVMKIDLSSDELRTDLYNRDVGYGVAESIVEDARSGILTGF